MTKYNEIEIQTAKNLLEKGYKWIVRDSDIFGSNVYAYAEKPYKELYGWQQPNCCECVYIYSKSASIFQNIRFNDKEPTSLEAIVHPPILDDAEKRYLKGVIRPFRYKVDFICKVNFLEDTFQHIVIGIANDEAIALPLFESGTMYKGMEIDRAYTPKELGL